MNRPGGGVGAGEVASKRRIPGEAERRSWGGPASRQGLDDLQQADPAEGTARRHRLDGDGAGGQVGDERRGAGRARGRSEELGAGLLEERFSGRAEEAVVTDLGEAPGQDVLEESRDELWRVLSRSWLKRVVAPLPIGSL